MRFSKSLAAVGILGISLFTATALAGAAQADTTHAKSQPAVVAPVNSSNKDKSAEQNNHRHATATLSATVAPGQVRRGGYYTVRIATKGVNNGTKATVANIDGTTSTVTIRGGAASKTLRVPSSTKPGSYTVTVTEGTLSATADVHVTR